MLIGVNGVLLLLNRKLTVDNNRKARGICVKPIGNILLFKVS